MTMTYREQEEARVLSERKGQNMPLELCPVRYDGHRSLRIELGSGEVGMATTTYSYKLIDEEKANAARRMAALWNLAAAFGWSTEQIEQMVAEQNAKNGSH